MKGAARDAALAVLALVVILGLLVGLARTGTLAVPPPEGNRPLADKFLKTTYNWTSDLWSASPEVVTSILWDYRGLDTVYETGVFFLAIIGAIALVRGIKTPSLRWRGMSVVARTVSKITLVAIPVVAASIALHGHLTPGGGFQGGSVFAVASLLAIVALGTGFLTGRGWSKDRLLAFRTLGLLLIALVAVSALILALLKGEMGYIMQNQWKPWARVGLGYLFGGGSGILYSGSLFFLNLAEFLAVSAGLSLVFILMGLPWESLKGGASE